MVIRLKVPIEMHYTVIPMGTSKVNSSPLFVVHIGNNSAVRFIGGLLNTWPSSFNHILSKCVVMVPVVMAAHTLSS